MTETKEFTFSEWFLKNKGWIFYSFISTVIFGVVSLQQNCRQNYLETQVIKAEQNAIHRVETNYSLLISGLLQSATIIETNLIEQRNHNRILIGCAKQKNCSNEILTEKTQKPYIPMAEHYIKIQTKMSEQDLEKQDN